jgi:hypothetical protein
MPYPKGYKTVEAWIDPDLHAALKAKLALDRVTLQAVLTRWIIRYTGFKREENVATGQKQESK